MEGCAMEIDKWATMTVDMDCTGLAIQHERREFAQTLEQLDPLATAGYVGEARQRIRMFAKYLREGRAIPRDHFLRFCDQLDSIAEGENPEKVLGMQKNRGKSPDPKRLERLRLIALCISTYMHITRMTLEDAIAALTDDVAKAKMLVDIRTHMSETGEKYESGYVESNDDDYRREEVTPEEYTQLRERTNRFTVEQLAAKISKDWVNGGAITIIHVGPSLLEIARAASGDSVQGYGFRRLNLSELTEREARLAWEIYGAYFRERQTSGKTAPVNIGPLKRKK